MSIITTIKNTFTNTSDFIRGTSNTLVEVVTNNQIAENITKIKDKGKEKRLLKQVEKVSKEKAKIRKEITKLWNKIETCNETIKSM